LCPYSSLFTPLLLLQDALYLQTAAASSVLTSLCHASMPPLLLVLRCAGNVLIKHEQGAPYGRVAKVGAAVMGIQRRVS
jgi:hypothetical protein